MTEKIAIRKCMKGKQNAKSKNLYQINVIAITLCYMHLLI